MHTLTTETTVRDVVAGDHRAATVFEKHGIDYCCGGARPIGAACREAGVAAETVLAELAGLAAAGAADQDYASWDPAALVDHIVSTHHAYVRNAIPTILAHTAKVAGKHGERHAELGEVARLFEGVAEEMTQHMMKEEHILFPYIKVLARQDASGCPAAPSPFGTVKNPIRMMEIEHENAGHAMRKIRELTGGFAPPADACVTYTATLAELDEFERDLHQHVHLENNILFPRAVEMER